MRNRILMWVVFSMIVSNEAVSQARGVHEAEYRVLQRIQRSLDRGYENVKEIWVGAPAHDPEVDVLGIVFRDLYPFGPEVVLQIMACRETTPGFVGDGHQMRTYELTLQDGDGEESLAEMRAYRDSGRVVSIFGATPEGKKFGSPSELNTFAWEDAEAKGVFLNCMRPQ